MKHVVLLSGGLDSTTLATDLVETGHEVIGVSFRYGSLHESSESNAASLVARALCIPLQVIRIDDSIYANGVSALLGQSPMPNAEYQTDPEEGPSATVVPFRNAIMLSMAVALAESRKRDFVSIATHATDSAHWAYPDCSPEFIGSMMAAAYIGTMHKVRLYAPFVFRTKAEIVALAAERYAPLQLTWSCYRGGATHCGRCPTCLERIHAFQENNLMDPVKYDVDIDWSNCREFPARSRV